MAIVFGSPETKAIVEADRKKFGDSRYPGEGDGEPGPAVPHEYKITSTATILVNRTYYVDALTAADARASIDLGVDYADQQEIDDLGEEQIKEVEDMGEAR
jgi:hypothetical protein